MHEIFAIVISLDPDPAANLTEGHMRASLAKGPILLFKKVILIM